MRPGQRVGKYLLGEPIARGGMAEVWAARVEGPGGFVKSLALKFILESFTGDAELERLFVNEARLAARLSHANLVSVFDFDELPGSDPEQPARYYIAMERVDGHDLRRLLQAARHKGRRLPPEMALYIAGEVLKGLRYVHERREDSGGRPLGLVHRDVSPHNVLVGFGGEVKLSDFGIAKAMSQSLGTQSGMVRGKLAYASPEQLRSEVVDHRADQFGLGVTLWEMLADRRLFDGADEVEIVGKVLRCEIPPLPVDAGIDPAVEPVVRRMLTGQVGQRFPTTAQALSAVLALPGYRADGAGLGELMHDLFAVRSVAVPPTVPMPIAPLPPPGTALAETSALERGADERQPAAAPPVGGGRGVDFVRSHRPAPVTVQGHSVAEQGIPVLLREESPQAIPVLVDPPRDITGSGYVSGSSQVIPADLPSWIDHPHGPPASRRRWWAVGAAALAVIAGVSWWAAAVRRAAVPWEGELDEPGPEDEAREIAAPAPASSPPPTAPSPALRGPAREGRPTMPPSGPTATTVSGAGGGAVSMAEGETLGGAPSMPEGARPRRSGKRPRIAQSGDRRDVARPMAPATWPLSPSIAASSVPVPATTAASSARPAPGSVNRSSANGAPIFDE